MLKNNYQRSIISKAFTDDDQNKCDEYMYTCNENHLLQDNTHGWKKDKIPFPIIYL